VLGSLAVRFLEVAWVVCLYLGIFLKIANGAHDDVKKVLRMYLMLWLVSKAYVSHE